MAESELKSRATAYNRLKDIKASHLGGIAGKAALAELPSEVEVDQVFFGPASETFGLA